MKRILKHMSRWFAILAFTSISWKMNAQNELLQKLKFKNEKVRDYIAEGILKIDVNFIKTPPSKVKIFYRKPDQFKVKKEGGISILPKGGITVDLDAMLKNKNKQMFVYEKRCKVRQFHRPFLHYSEGYFIFKILQNTLFPKAANS